MRLVSNNETSVAFAAASPLNLCSHPMFVCCSRFSVFLHRQRDNNPVTDAMVQNVKALAANLVSFELSAGSSWGERPCGDHIVRASVMSCSL